MLPADLMSLVNDKRFGSKKYWRRKFNASMEMIGAFKGRFPFRDSYVRGPFFTMDSAHVYHGRRYDVRRDAWIGSRVPRHSYAYNPSLARRRLNKAATCYYNYQRIRSLSPVMGLPDIWKDQRPSLEKALMLVRVARLIVLCVSAARDLKNKEIDQEMHDVIAAKIREQIKVELGAT